MTEEIVREEEGGMGDLTLEEKVNKKSVSLLEREVVGERKVVQEERVQVHERQH
jgi:hypothetical protein